MTATKGSAFAWALALSGAFAAAGCKLDSCDPGLVDRATNLLKAHQSCAVDDDCVVVSDFCETLPHGDCGQLVMNRVGRDSAEWADLSKALKDCSPDDCTVCGAQLVARCSNGSCNGP